MVLYTAGYLYRHVYRLKMGGGGVWELTVNLTELLMSSFNRDTYHQEGLDHNQERPAVGRPPFILTLLSFYYLQMRKNVA